MTPERFWLTVPLALVGAVLGSFLSTVAIRMADGRGWLTGRSVCDGCGRQLSPTETLPLLGFLRTGGACRSCARPINRLHILAEVSGGFALAVCGWQLSGGTLALTVALLVLLLAVGLIDTTTQRIPDGLTVLVGVTSLAKASTGGAEAIAMGLATATAAAGLLLALRSGYRRLRGQQGLGLGDVKLVAAMAPAIGPLGMAPVIAAASLGAIVWATIRRQGLTQRLPFGPFICLSAAAWLIWGGQLPDWMGGA